MCDVRETSLTSFSSLGRDFFGTGMMNNNKFETSVCVVGGISQSINVMYDRMNGWRFTHGWQTRGPQQHYGSTNNHFSGSFLRVPLLTRSIFFRRIIHYITNPWVPLSGFGCIFSTLGFAMNLLWSRKPRFFLKSRTHYHNQSKRFHEGRIKQKILVFTQVWRKSGAWLWSAVLCPLIMSGQLFGHRLFPGMPVFSACMDAHRPGGNQSFCLSVCVGDTSFALFR